jgi:hypothetical protein
MTQHYRTSLLVLIAILCGVWIGRSLDLKPNENQYNTKQQLAILFTENSKANNLIGQLLKEI